MLAEVEEAAAQKRVGAVLGGKWRLDALLGMGGVAWVYSATHRNQSRAAVKLLRPERAADPEARRWFLREGYVANSVRHPGVRVVLDDDEALGTAYLVMELLSGKSLGELRVMNGGRLPARAVLEAMAETSAPPAWPSSPKATAGVSAGPRRPCSRRSWRPFPGTSGPERAYFPLYSCRLDECHLRSGGGPVRTFVGGATRWGSAAKPGC